MSKKVFALVAAIAMMISMVPVGPTQSATIVDGGEYTCTGGCFANWPASAVFLVQGSNLYAYASANVWRTYHPGAADFSTVQTANPSDFASYTVAGYVAPKVGVFVKAKDTSFSGEGIDVRTVYLVGLNGVFHPVYQASVYKHWTGDNNFQNVYLLPDAFTTVVAPTMGALVDSTTNAPAGMASMAPNGDYGYVAAGNTFRAFSSEAALAANKFNKTMSAKLPSALAAGSMVTGAESTYVAFQTKAGGAPAPVIGTFSVALASDTPASANVPITAQGVVYTKFRLIGGSETATVTSLTVKRLGLGAAADFASIGLFEGDIQVGTYKTLSSATDTTMFTFSTPVVLAPGQVKYYSLKATLTGSVAGHVNQLGVSAVTGATASGLPIYGNGMTAVDISIGSVGVVHGSLSNASPKIGEDNVELAVLRLTPSSTEDVYLYSFKLRQTGTARASDLANLAVYQSGTKVGDCTMVSDYLTCSLYTPFEIKKSQLKEFKVLGDIEDGYNRTVILDLEEVYDVNVVGKSYGFPVPATDSYTAQTATISAGALTVNFNGPNSADVTRSQQDINLANFEITSNNENAELRTFLVDILVNGSASTSTSYIEYVELYDPSTGGIYDGSIVGNQFRFSPYLTLTKGVKKTLQIRFDTPYGVSVADGTTYSVNAAATDMTIRGLTSNQNITDISPSTLTGKLMTLKAPALTVTPITLVNETIVGGKKGVPLYKGVLTAAGETIKVTEMVFSAHTGSYFTDANVDHVYLYKVDGATETLIKELTESQFAGTNATFTGMNFQIPAGTANSVTFIVRVDVAINASGYLGIEITSGTDGVVAETLKDGTAVVEGTGHAGVNGRTVTLATKGALTADMDIATAEVNQDLYRVANTTTGWLGRIKLDASYEDVKITTITLTNTTATAGGTDPSDSIEYLDLYKADKTTMIGRAAWAQGSSEAIFDLSPNYIVDDVGVDYLYLKATLKKIGTGYADTADSFDEIRLRVKATTGVVAYGNDTGSSITDGSGLTIGTTYTKSSVITAAGLVSVTNGLTDGNLGSGIRTIAKFKVAASATSNLNSSGDVADLLLKQLKITFTGNVTAASATIEREGGVDTAASINSGGDLIATGEVTIDVDGGLANDHKIEPSTEATYVIKATVEYTGSGTKWLQSQIKLLNTGSSVIIWNDGHSDFTSARTSYNNVDGAYLSIMNQ